MQGARAASRSPRGAAFQGIAWPLAVAVAAVVAHAVSLGGGFTGDDHAAIAANRLVTGPLDLRRIFTTNYWWGFDEQLDVLYRPVTVLVHHVVHHLGGGRAWVHHAANLLLHALVSLEVLALGRRLLPSTAAAAALGLMFAVHPLASEPVDALVGRADLLAALFGLEACRQHFRPGLGSAVASAGCAALACLSKESAFPVLVWMVLADLVLRRGDWRVVVPRWLALAVAMAVTLGLRVHAVGSIGHVEPPPFSDNPLFHWTRASQVRTALAIAGRSLGAAALPVRLSADYSFDQIPEALSWLEPRVLVGLAGVVAMAVAALSWRRPRIAAAALFAALTYLPVSNLLVPMRTVTAERLLYLPLVGVLALGVAGWEVLRRRRAVAARVLGLALCGLLAVRSAERALDWHDDLTLSEATALASPRSWRAQTMLASALAKAGRAEDAEQHYRRALAIDPRVVDNDRALATLLARRGAAADAVEVLEAAVREGPRDGGTWLALAQLRLQLGRDEQAGEALARVEELAGDIPSVRIGRAAIALRHRDAAAALRDLDGVVAERPERADEVWPMWIEALLGLGRDQEALSAAEAWTPHAPRVESRRQALIEKARRALEAGGAAP